MGLDDIKAESLKWLKPHSPKNLIGWLLVVVLAMLILLGVFVLIFRQTLHIGQTEIFVSGVPEQSVPVGGIIMWWGDWLNVASRPKGFDLCDGGDIRDTQSSLNGKFRPDMSGRYPIGAPKGVGDVLSKPVYGGRKPGEDIFTEGTPLSISQLPPHTHQVIEPNEGKGHSHANTEDFIFTGGGAGDRLIIPNAYRGTGGVPRIPLESPHGLMGTYPITQPATTGITIGMTGNSEPHNHKISDAKIEPPNLQLNFLIRIK